MLATRRPFVASGAREGMEKCMGVSSSEADEEDGEDGRLIKLAEAVGVEVELVRAVAKGLKMGS